MLLDLFRTATFLIVDDEPANVSILEQLLEMWGCANVHSTTDPRDTVSLFNRWQPDIILLDLMMPEMNGFQVMEHLNPLISADDYLPILVLTADHTDITKRRALAAGAKDFLTKPFDREELSLRLGNLLQTRSLHCQLQSQNEVLEDKVQERTQDLEKAQLETLQRLALAAEYRDDDTGLHTRRVGLTAARIAQALGLPPDQVDLILRAAPLHDVGKIGVPDSILLKPGKLTDEEFDTMRQHTIIGAGILSGSSSPWLHLAEEIAISHHERWDGRGYPNGLSGEDIPLVGRIVAVADVFDALTNKRPYKEAWPFSKALAEIESQSGKQFDERVVKAFLPLPHETLV
jgi:putative two-component system response regulator